MRHAIELRHSSLGGRDTRQIVEPAQHDVQRGGAGFFLDHGQGIVERHRSLLDAIGQCRPFDKLQHERMRTSEGVRRFYFAMCARSFSFSLQTYSRMSVSACNRCVTFTVNGLL